MANEHYEQLRQLKRQELDRFYRRLEITIQQLGELHEQLALETDQTVSLKVRKQIHNLERQRQELMVEIDESEKGFAVYPLDNLPCPRNPNWVERNEELQALHTLLQEKRQQLAQLGDRSPVYCCCHGLPGVGKTQFVLEYAHSRLGSHYHTVVWIDGSGTDLRNAAAKAARELNLVNGESPTDDQRISALLSHLAQGGPHLVIIDNVDVPGALGRYLPRRGDVCVVVTARQKELPYPSLSYRVELFDEAKSLQFLRGPVALADEAEEMAAARLCEYLGYLPLALMLARLVYRNGLRPSFASLYGSIRQVGPERWRPSVDVDPFLLPYANFSALFEVSYQLLSQDARWLAAAVGYFAPAPIDRDLLCDAGACLAKVPIASKSDRDRWIAALEQIDRIGLVEHSGCGSHPAQQSLIGRREAARETFFRRGARAWARACG